MTVPSGQRFPCPEVPRYTTVNTFPIPPVDDEGSITHVMREMQNGNDADAAVLWQRFYVRLTHLVKDRLRTQIGGLSDEEDVALQSLGELFRGLLDGKYPSLDSREAFWRLLVTVSTRNVIDAISRENRLKRGAGRVFHESAFSNVDEESAALFEQIASSTETPEARGSSPPSGTPSPQSKTARSKLATSSF